LFLIDVPSNCSTGLSKREDCFFSDSMTKKVEFEANILSQYGDYVPVLAKQREEILEVSNGTAGVRRYREALGQTERMLKQIGAI
jgi:hypothetical protein